MTDRELLEGAALAVGLDLPDAVEGESSATTGTPGMRYQGGLGLWVKGPKAWFWWNPLDNDGDALRLAVKLEMGLLLGGGDGLVDAQVFSSNVALCTSWYSAKVGDDPVRTTRYVIVRAAYEAHLAKERDLVSQSGFVRTTAADFALAPEEQGKRPLSSGPALDIEF